MMSDKDDCARKCFSALQQIESNPVIWASLGCVFERKEPGSGSDGGTLHATASDEDECHVCVCVCGAHILNCNSSAYASTLSI